MNFSGRNSGRLGVEMTGILIPRHKRFAVRRDVQVRAQGRACHALMIEVSLLGCRVSAAEIEGLAPDQPVTIEIAGFGDVRGRVMSAGGRMLAIRFAKPIASASLRELVWAREVKAAPVEPEAILQLPAFSR